MDSVAKVPEFYSGVSLPIIQGFSLDSGVLTGKLRPRVMNACPSLLPASVNGLIEGLIEWGRECLARQLLTCSF